MKKLCLLALVLLCAFSLSCCSMGQQESENLYDATFFQNYTMNEHDQYIVETFYTLYPELSSARDYGFSNLVYTFGHQDETLKFDELQTNGVGNYWIFSSEIPAFYGALKRAEEYESSRQIDNTELAEKNGGEYAVKAESVEYVLGTIFRRQVPVLHHSFANVEYIEEDQVYVYDKLENPYQSFLDKGWRLLALPFSPIEDSVKLGELENYYNSDFIIAWYEEGGNVYYMDGIPFFSTDLAYEDFETSSILVEEYEKYMGRQMDRIYYDIIRIQFDAEQFVEEEKVLPDMPLDWMEIGLSEVLLGQGPTGDVPLNDNN